MKSKTWLSVLLAAVALALTLGLVSSAESRTSEGTGDPLVVAKRDDADEGGTHADAGKAVTRAGAQAVYRLQGELLKPDGSPYTLTVPLMALPLDPFPASLASTLVMATGGQFDAALPEGLYWLSTEQELLPYYMPRVKVDLRSDTVGMAITLLDHREPPLGDRPPDAALISVGTPDMDGYAVVTGAPGAVPPYSAVAVANLSAATVVATASDATGAFTTTALYAPPGSSLLIKYDLDGGRVVRFWEDAQASATVTLVDYLNVLPGTILTVGDPEPKSGSAQPFSTVGTFWETDPKGWAGWWLSGTLDAPDAGPGLRVVPGQTMTLTAELRVNSPGLGCTSSPTASVIAGLEFHQAFGPDGRADPWGIDNQAFLFTPTGLPISSGGSGKTIPVAGTSLDSWTCATSDTIESPLSLSFTVPTTLTEATYLPEVLLLFPSVPLTTAMPIVPSWYNLYYEGFLPPVTVGDPAQPQLPWTLLADYPVNGHRGVQAREDVGHYQLRSWVTLPPEQVVVPRLDQRTGEPLLYRLEPGSGWISATDRRLPNPPHIPLDLPSGHLYVEVVKPDGGVDVLGSATVAQASVRTPATPSGEAVIGVRSGRLGDVYHLTTMADEFAYSFDQYGLHEILMFGTVDDVYGNSYDITATYEVHVARVLDVDTGQLPTMPYVQGDAFAPGLHLYPPVPAEVTVRLEQMPLSDPALASTTIVTGQANRYGYFQPPQGTEIRLWDPGEFRVDVTATYLDANGTLWMGAVTWGNVIEGNAPAMEAHGRRGLDYNGAVINLMSPWFEVDSLPPEHTLGAFEVYYPYWSGDIHWGLESRQPGDSIHPIVTIKDIHATGTYTGPIYDVLKANHPRGSTEYRRPPSDARSYGNLTKRMEIGEAPLFISTQSGVQAGVAPDEVDQWGYWYGSSQRPGVRVREYISEDMLGVGYWGFDDTYNYQLGVPAEGDLPGDIKWEFGGAVLRTVPQNSPLTSPVALSEYAIYSSLWVLLPRDDAQGARVTTPFRGANGTSLDGGPILTMTVQGQVQEVDMLFLPRGVLPGDVLELGDVIAISGHVGPPLDSRVSVTLTAPTGAQHAAPLRANKIGWVYDPGFDLPAYETGRWTVDVHVVHDRHLAYAGGPFAHNTGTVMGTTGRYAFYVVDPDVPRLTVSSPAPGVITWPQGEIEPIHIRGSAPPGTTAVHYTIYDKGVVMGQGSVAPDAGGGFVVTYDAKELSKSFSMLSLTAREGKWEGLADEVAISLLAVGAGEPLANTVTLIGEEVFIGGELARVYLPVVLDIR